MVCGMTSKYIFKTHIYAGTWDQGGPGGAGPPLELRFYRVKIFKIGKISFFLLFGPPLGKHRSQGPGSVHIFERHTSKYLFQ